MTVDSTDAYTCDVRIVTESPLRHHPCFTILLYGLLCGGCSTLPDWLQIGPASGSPHRGGLADDPADVGLSRQSTGSVPGDDVHIVGLTFDVIRIDLPFDEIQHSRKVWNHVDELRVDTTVSARLARNGVRIGAAASDAWPAIQAIVELSGASVRRNQLEPQRGAPLVIELGDIGDGESIFTYGPGGGLAGKTFQGGKKLIAIDYDYHPELGGFCELVVGLEIRRELHEMTWENRDGVIRQVPAMDRHVFTDLRAGLSLRPGEMLMVGLSDSARTAYLVGSQFLSTTRAGRRIETLLCLKPKTYSITRRTP